MIGRTRVLERSYFQKDEEQTISVNFEDDYVAVRLAGNRHKPCKSPRYINLTNWEAGILREMLNDLHVGPLD